MRSDFKIFDLFRTDGGGSQNGYRMVWHDDIAIRRGPAAIDHPMSEPLVGDEHRSLREGHVDAKAGEFEELICPGSCGIDE